MNRISLCFMLLVIVSLNNSGRAFAQINWLKSENSPLLTPGGTWTSHGFPFTFMVEINDTLHMWFTGADGDPISSDRIGYGYSTDGINFDLLDNPVLEPSFGEEKFDSQGVFGASVIVDGELFRMWYNGYDSQPYYSGALRAGYATSEDGINWTRYSPEPVLDLGPAGSWDGAWAYVNTVLFEDGIYKMWYTGFDGYYTAIGYATSPDGVTWSKYAGNPVIQPGGSGFGGLDAAQNPRVILNTNGYEMWFNGQYTNPDFNIYYASSTDGIEWNYSYEPIMTTGEEGSFDDIWVWHPCVIFENGVYRMWYSGYNGTEWSVGYATDSTMTGVDLLVGLPVGQLALSVFPNPASSNAQFTFRISQENEVSLKIYNAHGLEMMTLLNGRLQAGEHSVRYDTRSLPEGIYFCRLETNLKCQVVQMLVVR